MVVVDSSVLVLVMMVMIMVVMISFGLVMWVKFLIVGSVMLEKIEFGILMCGMGRFINVVSIVFVFMLISVLGISVSDVGCIFF